MDEQQLRAMIREAVARHLGARAIGQETSPSPAQSWHDHFSHNQFVTLVNVGDACLIEPAVACNHCGYCKSQGH